MEKTLGRAQVKGGLSCSAKCFPWFGKVDGDPCDES